MFCFTCPSTLSLHPFISASLPSSLSSVASPIHSLLLLFVSHCPRPYEDTCRGIRYSLTRTSPTPCPHNTLFTSHVGHYASVCFYLLTHTHLHLPQHFWCLPGASQMAFCLEMTGTNHNACIVNSMCVYVCVCVCLCAPVPALGRGCRPHIQGMSEAT